MRRFRDTPLITGPPSGGVHLWYREPKKRCRTPAGASLKVGIRGLGGTVVVPPSIRPAGWHAGKAYTFAKRPWDDVVRLPTVKRAALHDSPVV